MQDMKYLEWNFILPLARTADSLSQCLLSLVSTHAPAILITFTEASDPDSGRNGGLANSGGGRGGDTEIASVRLCDAASLTAIGFKYVKLVNNNNNNDFL
jgi:hypothetical protein